MAPFSGGTSPGLLMEEEDFEELQIPKPVVRDEPEPTLAVSTEIDNEQIRDHVSYFRSKFGSSWRFDSLYMPVLYRNKVRVDPDTKNVYIFESSIDIDIFALLAKEIGEDVEKAAAFLCFRKEYVTQIELDYCLKAMLKSESLPEFLELNPEFIDLVVKQLSGVEIVTFDSGSAFFQTVTQFFYGTTPVPVIVNFLKQMGSDFERFLFQQDDVDTIPPLETLISEGYQPRVDRVSVAIDFVSYFFDHFAKQGLNEETRKDKFLTESYELEGFFHKFFQLTPFMSITQALEMLEIYYRKLVKTLPQDKNKGHISADDAEYTVVGEDRLSQLPFLDYLDVYFSEHINHLTVQEVAWILFVFVKSGKKDAVLAVKTGQRLLDDENMKLRRGMGTDKTEEDLRKQIDTMGPDKMQDIVNEWSITLRLVWSLSKFSKNVQAMEVSWKVLESRVLRSLSQLKDSISSREIGILISCFYELKQGSDELWSGFLYYSKTHPNHISLSLKCLVYHYMLTRGMLSLESGIAERTEYVRNQIQENFGQILQLLIDHLTILPKDRDPTVPDSLGSGPSQTQIRILLVLEQLIFSFLIDLPEAVPISSIPSRDLLFTAVVQLLKHQEGRRTIGNDPVSLIALIQTVSKIINSSLLAKEYEMNRYNQGAKDRGQFYSPVRKGENTLEQDWRDFDRLLYFIERKVDSYSILFPLVVYIYLGKAHLLLQPVMDRLYPEKEDEFFENLKIKRRVMYHTVESKLKSLSKEEALKFLEICRMEEYMDDTVLNYLILKMSTYLDDYSFEQVYSIGLLFRHFGLEWDHPFWALFEEVMDVLAGEMVKWEPPREENSEGEVREIEESGDSKDGASDGGESGEKRVSRGKGRKVQKSQVLKVEAKKDEESREDFTQIEKRKKPSILEQKWNELFPTIRKPKYFPTEEILNQAKLFSTHKRTLLTADILIKSKHIRHLDAYWQFLDE